MDYTHALAVMLAASPGEQAVPAHLVLPHDLIAVVVIGADIAALEY